jgi:hypothetical protein
MSWGTSDSFVYKNLHNSKFIYYITIMSKVIPASKVSTDKAVLELDERSRSLLQRCAAAFWENHFQTPFPEPDIKETLPKIHNKTQSKKNICTSTESSANSTQPYAQLTMTGLPRKPPAHNKSRAPLRRANSCDNEKYIGGVASSDRSPSPLSQSLRRQVPQQQQQLRKVRSYENDV